MLSETEFREIVSGRRRGVAAGMLRGGLAVLEVPYACFMQWRNRGYDQGRRPIERVAVPVVSVGNLTMGGTGKTPMVEWLAKWFRQQDVRVTLISRGYKPTDGGLNDEALELEQKLPDVPHLQNRDRVAAARTAIEDLECQLIVLDDAFQHRRISRDLDIVLIDATEPFGFDHVFPRGTLREPLAGMVRADVVALTRADMLPPDERQSIRERVGSYAPQATWLEVCHGPHSLLGWPDHTAELDGLRGQPVAAFCGIGNPQGFRHTLTSCGYETADFRAFPDHHDYQRSDLDSLAGWAAESGAAAAVCTHKDLVKIGVPRLGDCPLWALRVEMQFLSGEDRLTSKLQELLPAT